MIASPPFEEVHGSGARAMGRDKPQSSWKEDLESAALSVYSQGGEDGVLLRLFDEIGVHNQTFVEFGAADGERHSNTANLRLQHGWSGLLMEASDHADGSLVQHEYVDPQNVETLFKKYDVPSEFDLLSIDIDGHDYWVWNAIQSYRPHVVIVEYNIFFLPDMARTIAYDSTYRWDHENYVKYHGASLAAFKRLARQKGYALVYTEPFYPNAIFVREDTLPAALTLPEDSEWDRWNWDEDSYVEPTAQPGGEWVAV
jgi:hypothetical protein